MPERRSVLITLLIILTACAPPNTTTNLTPEAWQADLQHLARELPNRHVNAFHTGSREAFAQEVARLNTAIPQMRDEEVLTGTSNVSDDCCFL